MKKLSNQNVFLKEVDSFFLRRAIFNLEDVYKKFFTKRNKSYWAHCIRDIDKGKKYSNIEFDMIVKIIKLPKLAVVKIRDYQMRDLVYYACY